jgi:hypothetical protein
MDGGKKNLELNQALMPCEQSLEHSTVKLSTSISTPTKLPKQIKALFSWGGKKILGVTSDVSEERREKFLD